MCESKKWLQSKSWKKLFLLILGKSSISAAALFLFRQYVLTKTSNLKFSNKRGTICGKSKYLVTKSELAKKCASAATPICESVTRSPSARRRGESGIEQRKRMKSGGKGRSEGRAGRLRPSKRPTTCHAESESTAAVASLVMLSGYGDGNSMNCQIREDFWQKSYMNMKEMKCAEQKLFFERRGF